MPVDLHAHYVPPQLLAAVEERGSAIGVTLRGNAIAFAYGFATRQLFPLLVEPVAERRAWMGQQGVDRQVVATWPDMFGYGLSANECAAWHGILNQTLAEWCMGEVDAFSWLASVPLPDAEDAEAELERAAELGAIGAILPANVEGMNIGELALDPLWRRAEALDMPVLIHPVLVTPVPRAARFALAQIVQYPFDTTLGLGSLLATGVLDRFPRLVILGAHGGGALPWLAGRFDVMHERIDRAAQGVAAQASASSYLRRLAFDTIVHNPAALCFLRDSAGIGQLVLGSDYSFPPADTAPIETLRQAFTPDEVRAVCDENPRRLFPRLHGTRP